MRHSQETCHGGPAMLPENKIAADVLRCALRIHRRVGPGMLEKVYRRMLAKELRTEGHVVKEEVAIPVTVDGVYYDKAYVADLIIDDCVIVETKSVAALIPV